MSDRGAFDHSGRRSLNRPFRAFWGGKAKLGRSVALAVLVGATATYLPAAGLAESSPGGKPTTQVGQAPVAEPVRPDPATVQKLLAKSENQPVRVIIEFDLTGALGQPYQPEAALAANRMTAQRQAIAAVRDSALAALGTAEHGNVKTYSTLPMIALEVSAEALRRLASHPNVVSIKEDIPVPPGLAKSVPRIGAGNAHDQGFAGSNWAVAIVDSGVDTSHPFFAGRIVAEACFSTTSSVSLSVCPGGFNSTEPGSGISCPLDLIDCHHGTHVAGIAAGAGQGFGGVAPGADIIAIQVFSEVVDQGWCQQAQLPTPCLGTFPSDQLLALEHVALLKDSIDIAAVNMSLGGGAFAANCDDDPRKPAIDNLRAAGIATVIASGNSAFDGAVGTPACISSAIAVGSTTKTDQVSEFSNHAGIIDLMAPGSAINSSLPGGGFGLESGTSMAAPHVSGAVAALRSADPLATVDEIEGALTSTGRGVTRALVTKPRIQVDAAVAALLEGPGVPRNDGFEAAILLAGAFGSSTGSNINAIPQPGEPVHAGVGGGSSVWWRWSPPSSGEASIDTFGSNFDTVLAIYTGPSIDQLTEVASNDDSGGSRQSQVTFTAQAGVVYMIAVDGFVGAEGGIVLNHGISLGVGSNDNLADAVVLTGPFGVVNGTNRGATGELGEPLHAGVGGGKSVWWQWAPPFSGVAAVATIGSSFDTVLAVYVGDQVNQLAEVASNDDGDAPGAGLASLVLFEAVQGVNYRIAVDGFAGAEGDIALTFLPFDDSVPPAAKRHVASGLSYNRLATAIGRFADLD